MPRGPIRHPRLPYQVAEREIEPGTIRLFLQRQDEHGAWRDIAGPYKQRGSAMERYRRIRFREIMEMRKRGEEPDIDRWWRLVHAGRVDEAGPMPGD